MLPFQFDSGESFSAAGSSETDHTIANLSSGDAPKYLVLTTSGSAGVEVAVGASTISANATPMFYLQLGMDPVCINVSGMTTISIQNDDAGAQTIYVGYLANY